MTNYFDTPEEKIHCPECHGGGKVWSGNRFIDCEPCDGTGQLTETEYKQFQKDNYED